MFLERTRILRGIQFTTHFIEFLIVEIKRFVGISVKRDFDAANLRPALEQGYGKQTPGARKLFFRMNLLHVPNTKM